MPGSEDGSVEGIAGPAGPVAKRQRVRPAAGSSDVEAADYGDADSGMVRGDETDGSGILIASGNLGPHTGKPPVHRGAEKDPRVVSRKDLERPLHKADAALNPALRNRASLRNTALRSVLKVFVMKCDPNYAQPWQMRPQRSSSGSAFVICSESRRILTNAHVVRHQYLL